MVFYALWERSLVAGGEQTPEMRCNLRDRRRPVRADDDCAAVRCVSIRAHFAAHGEVCQRQGLRRRTCRAIVRTGRGQRLQGLGFAMQPVGREVAAVSPDRALLHTTERLPDILTAFDLGTAIQNLAIGSNDLLRERWLLLVNL